MDDEWGRKMKYYGNLDFLCEDHTEADKMIAEYWNEFETIKECFPKKFVEIYIKTELHDFIVEKLYLKKHRLKDVTKLDVVLELRFNDTVYELRYIDTKVFNVSIDVSDHYAEIGDYVCGEFHVIDDRILSHEFEFFNESIILVHFHKLQFKKLK